MRVLLLSARRYEFTSESDGRILKGVSINYLEPLEAPTGDDARGMSPVKMTADTSIWNSLTELPGVYDVEFGRRAGAKGKAESVLKSAKFAKAFDLAKAMA